MTFLRIGRWAITWQWRLWWAATDTPFMGSGREVGDDYWWFGPIEIWRKK